MNFNQKELEIQTFLILRGWYFKNYYGYVYWYNDALTGRQPGPYSLSNAYKIEMYGEITQK